MDNESIDKRVLHLREVEKLSARQIAKVMGMGCRRIKRILEGSGAKPIPKVSIVEPYRNLIATWYQEYPRLKAKQIYERLKPYGYQGSYPSVAIFSREYRLRKSPVYHTLSFLPGEEAQVDWFFFRHERLGMLAGFLYVLAYSRYAWGRFYPKTSFEFFLAGHLECFEHLKGLARRHRYDNLKSVVIQRESRSIEYNAQFLDFARFFGFSIHVCNPASGNEKGRVERVIRDVRIFLYGQDFADLKDLNLKFRDWLIRRNQTLHRSTGKTPLMLLSQEKLLGLPQGTYPPTRTIPAAAISKTALVEFETNRYSVPSGCASKKAEIIAWPEKLEIFVESQKVACHPRCFQRDQLIQNPLHTQRLLDRSPRFKYERNRQLITQMDPAFDYFLKYQENDTEQLQAAYELFGLLKTHSRAILVSAVRQLNQMRAFKIKALRSLLNLPYAKESDPLWPSNQGLLNLRYEPRSLKDYDPTTD
jgi:transposase